MAWLGDACWLLLNQEDVRAFHAYFNADPPPFYPLKQVLDDGRACEGIREAAANLLGMPGVKGSRIPLIMALASPVPVRKAAVKSLAKRGKPRWRDLVKGDSQDFIRLGRRGGPQAVDAMIAALLVGGHGELDAIIQGLRASESRRARNALKEFFADTGYSGCTSRYP